MDPTMDYMPDYKCMFFCHKIKAKAIIALALIL